MILNCDIGERGGNHPEDVELMSWIDLANIACGGHAGDADSVQAFRRRAEEQGIQFSAHLSYPDRGQFGRVSLDLSPTALSEALDRQWSLLPDATTVKFHGALYNDASRDRDLARSLVQWLIMHGVQQLVCPPDSALAGAAEGTGMKVLREGFVERRYQRTPDGAMMLVPRSDPRASIQDPASALAQAHELIHEGGVRDVEGTFQPLEVDTLCIHSDSPLALELAREVRSMLEGRL